MINLLSKDQDALTYGILDDNMLYNIYNNSIKEKSINKILSIALSLFVCKTEQIKEFIDSFDSELSENA